MSINIIAEIGSNHCGSLDLAIQHIQAASRVGATAVKFQHIVLNEIWHCSATDDYRLSQKEELPTSWIVPLRQTAHGLNLQFGLSPTFRGSCGILAENGVDFIKLASPQVAFDPSIVDEAIQTRLPLVISNGYSDLPSTEATLRDIHDRSDSSISFLYCVSQYPADGIPLPIDQIIYLRGICTDLGIQFGFSDHYHSPIQAGIFAGLGAVLFEKHLKTTSAVVSKDSNVAIDASDFSTYVKHICDVSECVGDHRSRDRGLFEKAKTFASLTFAVREIEPGETISLSHIRPLRSDTLRGLKWNWVYGKLRRGEVIRAANRIPKGGVVGEDDIL